MLPPSVSGHHRLSDLNDCMYKNNSRITADRIENLIHPFYSKSDNIRAADVYNLSYKQFNGRSSLENVCTYSSKMVDEGRQRQSPNQNVLVESIHSDSYYSTPPSIMIPVTSSYNDNTNELISQHQQRQQSGESGSPENESLFCYSTSSNSCGSNRSSSLSPPIAMMHSASSSSSELSPNSSNSGTGRGTGSSENLYLLEQFSCKHSEKCNLVGSQQQLQQQKSTDTAAKKNQRLKSGYKHIPHKDKPPHLVARRNARERRRVQAVNTAFGKLRKHIPYPNKNKRLSKVKTLKIAIDYIHQLQDMIEDYDNSIIKDVDTPYPVHDSYNKDVSIMTWHQQNYNGGYNGYGYCNN